MTTSADLFASERKDPPHSGPERPLLEGWLDFHRDTLLRKCEGLTEEQLKTRSCEPSTLTLLGLVRHMAEVEGWFNNNIADGRWRRSITATTSRMATSTCSRMPSWLMTSAPTGA